MNSGESLTIILLAIGGMLVGVPMWMALYGRSTGDRDRQFLASKSVEDFWTHLDLTAEERSRSTLYAYCHNYAGWTWQLQQDGRDVGTFSCAQVGEATFNCPPLETKLWLGNSTHTHTTITREIHVRDGGKVTLIEDGLWSQFTLKDGADSYIISAGEAPGRLIQNDRRVGAHFKTSVDVHVVAIDKCVPDYVKAIIISLLTMARMPTLEIL